MPSISFDDVSNAVGDIYSAADDSRQWQYVVEKISRLFDCSRVCLTWMDDKQFDAFTTVDDPEFLSRACLAAHLRDPLVPVAFSVPVGQAYSRREIVDEREFRRRELWSDWYRQRDLAEGLGCMLHMTASANWSLHVHRGLHQPEFDAQEVRIFQSLSDHILRAHQIGQKRRLAASYAEMFKRLPIGILLIDRNGQASVANDEAERILSQPGCPLVLHGGRIVCMDQQNANFLYERVAAATSGLPFEEATVQVNGGTRLIASVSPFGEALHGTAYAAEQMAIVVLRDLAMANSDMVERHLRRLFSLTPAEARLCVALASGLSLKEAAVLGEVTFKTARTYLDRVLAKTGTHQQSQLVTLMRASRPLFSSADF